METRLIFELPIFSNLLDESQQIQFDGLDIIISLKGYDNLNKYCSIKLLFSYVIDFQKTHSKFGYIPSAYNSIVELFNSEMFNELANKNKELFESENFRHFVMYIEDHGFYDVVCTNVEITVE